ncbi:hypothetical protein NPIL_31551 [Nephila pilipes]|uniref:Uncharacterized protein n=1 Tax=Nephila pilipes TaxID=299642 RepID=A0A8X6Q604_NEPPI|nr:hypothetical protein NPIL_31551 [Nephila pilipes]
MEQDPADLIGQNSRAGVEFPFQKQKGVLFGAFSFSTLFWFHVGIRRSFFPFLSLIYVDQNNFSLFLVTNSLFGVCLWPPRASLTFRKFCGRFRSHDSLEGRGLVPL